MPPIPPPQQPIFVNNQPFFGRVEEQKQFRQALAEMRSPPRGETLPYIFLLFGDGGIGKTTLTRRFHDIATGERPFMGNFQALYLDWEKERWRAAFQGGREHVSAEAVFDTLHEAAIRLGWGEHFAKYQEAKQGRVEAQRQADAALSIGEERDELAALRGAGATVIARLVRLALPVGESGEALARLLLNAGIQVGAEQAARLRAAAERRLRARLDETHFDLFLNPHQQLALALGDGLRRVAEAKPLLVFLDTYELADRADPWLRIAAREAGPRLLWVIAGRDDLYRSRLLGEEYFQGYTEEFPRRLQGYDMRQLARDDIRGYFAHQVPERPLDDAALAAISRATRGIPLAVREAADIWKGGKSLADIVRDIPEGLPAGKIVQQMTERYLLHCLKNDADRRALYALALARGDEGILRRLLNPLASEHFELDATLRRLERDYASVHRERARLHDAPEHFFRERLKMLRNEAWTREMVETGATVLGWRCQTLRVRLPLLEERCEDEDWIETAVTFCEYNFWLEEELGWRWLLPRLVEGLAYSRDLRQGLLKVAGQWKNTLSSQGKKRLTRLQAAEVYNPSVAEEFAEMVEELERLAKQGWLEEREGNEERRAILDWLLGRLAFKRKQHDLALRLYEQAEQGLPPEGEALRRQLGEALNELAETLIWPGNAPGAPHYSTEAERILLQVVGWLPENSSAWYRLGAIHALASRYMEAIAACQQALTLDPKDAYPHTGLGAVYCALGRYEEAIAAFQQAITLDPTYAAPHNGLGYVYRALGRNEEAIAACQRAITLDPKDAEPHNGLGYVYRALGRNEEAVVHLEKALQLDPNETLARSSLVAAYRQLGREAEAEEQLAIARTLISKENEYNRACFEAILGNVEEALALLGVWLAKSPGYVEWARRDPDFEGIREDPRFRALVG